MNELSNAQLLIGRVVLITGAGGGLGEATARLLAARGAGLALTDINEDRLSETRATVEQLGADVVAVAGDIVDPETTTCLAAEAAKLGRVYGLCNIAGISPAIPLLEVTDTDFDSIMGVNCKAQLFAAQAVLPHLVANGGGSIVNVSSVGANVALPNLAVYGASKAAVLALTRGIASEFASAGVRCNAICPGGIDTGMAQEVVASFPDREAAIALLTGRQLVPRFAAPDEVASLIGYLISDDAAFVTGATLNIDAGHTTT
jgi:2-keto-3-deoxy-L-fuconate dehydrogenase